MQLKPHMLLLAGGLLTLAALNTRPLPVNAANTLPPGMSSSSSATTTTGEGKVTVLYLNVKTGAVLAREYLSGPVGTAVKFDTTFFTQPFVKLGYKVVGDGTLLGSIYQKSALTYTVLLTPPTTTAPKTSKATVLYLDSATGDVLARQTLTGTVGSQVAFSTSSYVAPYLRQGYTVKADGTRNGATFQSDATAFTVWLNRPGTKTPAQPDATTETTTPGKPSVTPSTGPVAEPTPAVAVPSPAMALPTAVAEVAPATPFHQATMGSVSGLLPTAGTKAKAQAQAPTAPTKPTEATQTPTTPVPASSKTRAKDKARDAQQNYPLAHAAVVTAPTPQPGGGSGGSPDLAPSDLGAYFVSLSGKILFGVSVD